jgi:uroporphyrinogen-III decarboxylase
MREAGGDVIGLDWRVQLDQGWQRVGHDVAVMGNLDPVALFAKQDCVARTSEADTGSSGRAYRAYLQSGSRNPAGDASGKCHRAR